MSNRRDTSTTQSGLPLKIQACSKFYNALSKLGVNIEQEGATGSGGIALEYVSEEPTAEGIASEIAQIAGAFCESQERGELGDLQATVYDREGEVATWRIKSEWVQKLKNDEWDDETFLEAIDDTFEVK